MHENDIAKRVIGAAIEVHRFLSFGLMESANEACLKRELSLAGLWVETEVPIALEYKGQVITEAYRIDLLVESKVVVELKVAGALSEVHRAQLLTYLRLTKRKLGLLINFNVRVLKDGIIRVVNGL
ncbi:MAG: GxxExxY protein [Gammaproteobacteria bacterium]|nr:GxxExxY protein [Gammaproteobacteria bacterium]NIR90022.1 GxxExxY protein [Gammaproteobacteria bacterium]NIR99151.1 GxxExxY protein [Gammaproteobacteria bacterium]NIT64791.1 GxxExxY protein [Gammaproteobacteria bacterium]NIV53641.1 GxxExxY protein [Gammaproteobacteria bacterium]